MRPLKFILFFSLCSSAFANDIYLAQTAAGGTTGANCANALAISYFNSAGNWTAGVGSGTTIGYGTTVHFCGTINSPIAAQGSGTSGNNITLLWESGSKFSNTGTVFDSQSPITLDGQNYFILNGGTGNVGGAAVNLEVTGNGTGLSTQLAVLGVHMNSSHDVEIKNFGCSNLYIHTSPSDNAPGADSTACVFGNPQGVNISIHDSTFHDTVDGVLFSVTNTGTNMLQLYNMNMYNMDHSLFTSCNAAGSTGWFVHDNQLHDYANWDTTADTYHHDGWLMNINTGQTCDGIYFYNNLISGDFGVNNTSPLFFDQNGGAAAFVENTYIFNNIFTNTNTTGVNGWSNGLNVDTTPGPIRWWNNTVICPLIGGNSLQIAGMDIDVRNNVTTSCAGYVNSSLITTGVTVAAFDYNYYANLIGAASNAFSLENFASGSGNLATQFSAWQSTIQTNFLAGAESHSSQSSSANLNSLGVPQGGSPVIGVGVNLCNGIISCTGNLAALQSGTTAGNTIAAVPRASTWDMGAYVISTAQSGGGSSVSGKVVISGKVRQ